MIKKIVSVILVLLILPVIIWGLKKVYDLRKSASGNLAYIVVDTSRPQAPIDQKLWQNFAQGGEEPKDMIGPAIEKVRSLSPKLIRIDHIYDFYNVARSDGGYDFTRLDQAVKSILDAGAVPMLSLSYIPSQWSTDGKITSPPKDWNLWQNLVTATVERYSGKSGLNIYNVYYEVYNEPDLFGNWRYGKDPNYLSLYLYSSRGAARAQNVNPFKIGGPATTGFYPNWIKALVNYCDANRLPLDFLSWHRYSPSLSDYDADVDKIIEILTDYPDYQNVERIITEFGPGPERSAWYENRVGAAQAISVSTHLLDRVHRIFGFELKGGPGEVGSQWGMLTHETKGAKPKPRWFAYQFLNLFSGARLPLEGNGDWVSGVATKEGDDTKLLLVNYDPLGRHSEFVPVRFDNLSPGNYEVAQNYLFSPDSKVSQVTDGTSLFRQIPLLANDAVLITITPQ